MVITDSGRYKVSISVDEETLLLVQKALRERRYRNRSHAFEDCIWRVLGGEGDG